MTRLHAIRSMPARASALSLVAALVLGSCASHRVVHQATIDRGYPTRGQLDNVTKAPLPPRETALRRGLTVEQWDLAGPFPDKAGSLPFTGDDPLARTVADRLAQRRSDVVLTESMQCYAREMGRFVARHGQLPDDDLQAFAAGLCGAVPIAPSFLFSMPEGELPNDAAVQFFDRATAPLPASSELGIWRGSEADRHVVLAAFGVPKVKIVAIDSPLAGARTVRIRGTILDATAWLRAYTGEGLLGFHACDPTRPTAAVLPDFDLTCTVASEDPYAVFDMLSAAPHALLGRQVLMLVLPTGRPVRPTFRRLAVYGVPPRGGLLEQFNAVRAQLGREPLRDVPVQSRTAHALVPHYFTAAANKDAASVDFITLGMMAGWDVAGPLRDSQFLSFRGMLGQGASSFLSQLLFFPSNRAVLLDRDAKEVALATMQDDKDKGVWGLLTTYTAFEPRSYPEVEAGLLDELDRQRQSRGKPPVARIAMRETDSVLEHVMEKLARGQVNPNEGLAQVLRTLTRRMQRGLDGRVSYATAVDGWRPMYDGALVDQESVAVISKVGFFAAPGDHWGQYVSYFIYGASFDPNPGSTIPKRGAR